jgi:hypothetical protein
MALNSDLSPNLIAAKGEAKAEGIERSLRLRIQHLTARRGRRFIAEDFAAFA